MSSMRAAVFEKDGSVHRVSEVCMGYLRVGLIVRVVGLPEVTGSAALDRGLEN